MSVWCFFFSAASPNLPTSANIVFGAHPAKTSTQLDKVPQTISKIHKSFWVVPGFRQSAFVLLLHKPQRRQNMVEKGLPHPPIGPFPIWWFGLVQRSAPKKSILDIFFRPERSTALAFDWNLLTDWWSVGTSEDHGITGLVEGWNPSKNHQGELWKEILELSEPSTELWLWLQNVCTFPGCKWRKKRCQHINSTDVSAVLYLYIYIYEMYFLCDVYL